MNARMCCGGKFGMLMWTLTLMEIYKSRRMFAAAKENFPTRCHSSFSCSVKNWYVFRSCSFKTCEINCRIWICVWNDVKIVFNLIWWNRIFGSDQCMLRWVCKVVACLSLTNMTECWKWGEMKHCWCSNNIILSIEESERQMAKEPVWQRSNLCTCLV